jgi:GNAT superfamily N-acetyltransferase
MQRTGVGKRLMAAVVSDPKSRGFNSIIVWVLAANPSRRFYEKLGGDHTQTRNITIEGKQLEEYGYGWKNPDSLGDCAGPKKNESTGQLQAPLVRGITPEDYCAVDFIARAPKPVWFTESALEEISHAVRHECGYVALQSGMHIGFATYQLKDDIEMAELTWIGVHPDFQGKGVGRRLVEAIGQELCKRGFKTLEVYTMAATVNYEPYATTTRFYHGIGFSDVSVEPKRFPSNDDKLLLRKRLG